MRRNGKDTLVLDMNWQPVSFCSWQDAVRMIWKGSAGVVKEDESGKVLHSPSFEIGMPRVIRVRNAWVKRKREKVPFSRRNVLIRDERICQYCGREVSLSEFQLDHVIPRSRGGLSTWENLVTSCMRCNRRKANRLPSEAGMSLLNTPVEPSVNDVKFTFKLHIEKIRKEWKEWSSWLYWNIELDK